MTKTRQDRQGLDAAPRDYRCSELCLGGVFMPAMKLLLDAKGPAPTTAMDAHRDVHRFAWAQMHLPGGACPLAQELNAKASSLVQLKERQRNLGPLGDGAALAKTLELTEKTHARVQAMLEKLPPEASRNVSQELRTLTRDREHYEHHMAGHRAGSPEWLAMLPAHRKLVVRTVELERLGDMGGPLAVELAGKVRAAAVAARNALATSLTAYIATALVAKRDKLLAVEPDTYRLYPRSIPVEIARQWGEVERVAGLVHQLRGSDHKGGDASWGFFAGLDPEMELALHLRLGVSMAGRPAEPVGKRKARPAKVEPEITIGFAE